MADAGAQADEATTADAVKEQQNVEDAPTVTTLPHTSRSSSPSPAQKPKRVKTGTSLASAPSSRTASPRTSRETSPTRSAALKLQQPAGSRLSRSRKNSQDQSPQRGPNSSHSIPSAAAIQRALAASGTTGATRIPSPITSEFASDVPKPQKQARPPPISRTSRLTSPPPASKPTKPTALPTSRTDLEPPPTPSIIVNSATPKSASSFDDIQEEEEEDMLRGGIRSPLRSAGNNSTLEAVQESTGPETPAIKGGTMSPLSRDSSLTRPAAIAETTTDDGYPKGSMVSTESGSDSAGAKSAKSNNTVERISESRKASISQPSAKQPSIPSRGSFTQLNSAKNKTSGEGSAGNMTVETETVKSVPQMTMGPTGETRVSVSKNDAPGAVRLKPSTETIRPKKEKKKTVRKAPSITSGTATSKADVFEAKIKSRVDEANSSDSEETFVYESNPPEPAPRHQPRYHSRTPSMTSIASQGEPYRNRFRSEGNNSLAGKKSMKFANSQKNPNSYNGDVEDVSSTGTPASAHPNFGNGSQQYPRHIGRHGRNIGHLSILDDNAPFQSPKSPRKANTGSFSRRTSPHPYTPRSPHLRSAKSIGGIPYDLEADDERTPLITSARTPRGSRRRPFPLEDYYYEEREAGFWKNLGKCVVLGSLVLLLVILVIFALVLCSNPLINVYVKEIANVLASDQEIIFDLNVHAVNPNLVAIQITDLDIFIFAKSKYVGTSKYWREHGQLPGDIGLEDTGHTGIGDVALQRSRYMSKRGVDEGTDPIDEDPHVMLLGQISHFDAPLIFEASPFKHEYSSSTGEVRLNKPGNATEAGGSDRWETVIQHDFELIVRGIVKYTLPVSSRVRSAAISGRKLVHPEDPEEPQKPIDDPKKNNTANGDVRISRSALRRFTPVPVRLPSRSVELRFSA